MITKKYLKKLVVLLTLFLPFYSLFSQTDTTNKDYNSLFSKVESLFKNADIPGLSLIIVDENNRYIKNWGYSDSKAKIPITSKTLFELGSTSKAFTALAILKLEQEGLLGLDDDVSKYIPWFQVFYQKKKVCIKIKNLLYHTSGIPMESISKIPIGESDLMLDKTIRTINNINLHNLPGSKYEYATINYDILGLIIEKISNLSFEDYLSKNIFKELGLNYTSVGIPCNNDISKGYKISFCYPKEYKTPKYRGNNPAGYVITNAVDMAKWLEYQLFIDSSCFSEILMKSHLPDITVKPHGFSLYAYGWQIEPFGETKIYHDGLNPNFSSFVGFIPGKKMGVVLLANSNSSYTTYIGTILLKLMNNEKIEEVPEPDSNIDKAFTLVSCILLVLVLIILFLFVMIIRDLVVKNRNVSKLNFRIVLKLFITFLLTIPFIYGIYLLPRAMMGFTWDSAIVWAPNSYIIASILFVVAILGVWAINAFSILIPSKNKYYRSIPIVALLSILSGISNMAIILLLINAIGSEDKTIYLIYYFGLALIFYISSNKVVQTKLINVSQHIVYELRMKLINKVFLSSFQKFEKIDNGRIYATLNQDTATISNSVNILIVLISNIITIIGVFIYLGSVSLMATGFILAVIVCVALVYFIVSTKTNILFEKARDASNTFSQLIDGLLYGFKELSLSSLKKNEYTHEVEKSCTELRNKTGIALIKFVNAFLIGETLLIMVLGAVCFIIPFLFPEIPNYKLLGFIMIVLYLIGPINAVLNSIPSIMQIKVSWKRINGFIDEINPDLKFGEIFRTNEDPVKIEKIVLKDLYFEYKNGQNENNFTVGPINLNINKGEILFVIGGNGSGKSTLVNLLTGLYVADKGSIEINKKQISNYDLGQFYSVIFSNHHIFKKLYGVDTENKKDELNHLLKLLKLKDKVEINNSIFSTINLSNGQRKRLSLLKCYLENSQIYLFDEWAADQDPEYKKLFYQELLPEMKKRGKIVIAVTHDDNYFDVADRIIKMNSGVIVSNS